MFNTPSCKKCGSHDMIIKTNDFQTIVECAECSYTYTLDNPEENHDIEECPDCGYEGVYTESIDEDICLKICPVCKNSYAATFDKDGE